MTTQPSYNLDAAVELIRSAIRVRGAANETVVRQTLITSMSDTFPAMNRPWWVERHILGAEQHLSYLEQGRQARGYADSVVGLTAIEYEVDLRAPHLFTEGKHQVRQYCTGLLNSGADPAKIRGVLSDTVEWRAYELADTPSKPAGTYKVEDVDLVEIEVLVCDIADRRHAESLIDFFLRYFGREGARPLTALSVADYLGFDSGFGAARLRTFDEVVRAQMAIDPIAVALVGEIWASFVSVLNVGHEHGAAFDIQTYVQEFYVATLAKLICANVVVRRALRSDDSELDDILDGRFFEAKGLHRLVEHDYFGWLTDRSRRGAIRPLARTLQADLAAYDFDASPSEDLFGQLLAALATRTQRILLGQEWTPSWLASRMAQHLVEQLLPGEAPRFVDMCCGSGSMLVATTAAARERLAEMGLVRGSREYLDHLVEAATGFDIDPLAVTLAKVNWVVTNRDALEPLNGATPVSLPVYHADSLFALGPVFTEGGDGRSDYRLRLLDREVILPRFLVQPGMQHAFDGLIDRCYSLAMAGGLESASGIDLPAQAVADLLAEVGMPLQDEERSLLVEFGRALTEAIDALQREGKNGVWAFIIRNSYRPGLVMGQFNGIISNPPWLAMSKVGGNPFGAILAAKARDYGLTPAGSAFLHLDMATVFLAYAIDHYLAEGGHVACVLPDTVRNGSQHLPLRAQLSGHGGIESKIPFRVDGLWVVQPGVFKNRAVVITGHRAEPVTFTELAGVAIGPNGRRDTRHYVNTANDRMVWSENPPGEGVPSGYPTGFASQGADLMPRRLVFFDVTQATGGRVTVSTPRRDGPNQFLVGKAKKHGGFVVTTRTIPDRFVHPCLLSAHLAPFRIARPSSAVLPVIATDAGGWRRADDSEIATAPTARDHFAQVIGESDFSSIEDFWARGLDFRRKLSRQEMPLDSWVVVYGAGGGVPAAASLHISEHSDRVIIDQTLYWARANDEDEALYLCGLINSEALLSRIADFIPEGEFGDRHLHTLPVKAVPLYDPSDATHIAVVAAARALSADLDRRSAQDQTVSRLLTTEMDMSSRRKQLRDAIAELASFETYAVACEAVYVGLE